MPKTESMLKKIDALPFDEFAKKKNRRLVDSQVEYALYLSAVHGVANAQMFYLTNRITNDWSKNPVANKPDYIEAIREMLSPFRRENPDRIAIDTGKSPTEVGTSP
jgi:hypothetical protein